MCLCTNTTSDINECAFANGQCSQLCINTRGSFTCGCQPGFQLDFDRRGCISKLFACQSVVKFNLTTCSKNSCVCYLCWTDCKIWPYQCLIEHNQSPCYHDKLYNHRHSCLLWTTYLLSTLASGNQSCTLFSLYDHWCSVVTLSLYVCTSMYLRMPHV